MRGDVLEVEVTLKCPGRRLSDDQETDVRRPIFRSGVTAALQGVTRVAVGHRPHEKLSVGLSYARHYGTTSEDIHFRPESALRDISSDAIAAEIDRNAVSGLTALIRVQGLLGEVPAGPNEIIRNSFEGNTYPAEVLRRRTRDRADVGDFVLAAGDLGEVLEKRESEFGYEVYHVRFLAETPLPGVDDDWFLAEHVRRFYTLDEFKRRLGGSIERGEAPPDALERFNTLTPAQQQEAVRESLLATWQQAGLREWVRERQAEEAAGRSWAELPDPE